MCSVFQVRVNTRLLYQQTKFNLLREESEGYAKLVWSFHLIFWKLNLFNVLLIYFLLLSSTLEKFNLLCFANHSLGVFFLPNKHGCLRWITYCLYSCHLLGVVCYNDICLRRGKASVGYNDGSSVLPLPLHIRFNNQCCHITKKHRIWDTIRHRHADTSFL